MLQKKIKGYLSLCLHAHLPYVRHPESEDMMEERWLFEAITETYIPLLQIFFKLLNEKTDFRLVFSLSPTLMGMLSDQLLITRYEKHLNNLVKLSEKEVKRTLWMPEFHSTALEYRERIFNIKNFWHKYDGKLLKAFNELKQEGVLEIITCCATHGYLPLMSQYPQAVKSQLIQGVREYQRHFDDKPEGIWLAECAYNPGDEKYLEEIGLKYFFVDTHGLLNAEPAPAYGVYAPVECAAGVFAFGRDAHSGRQVWSAHEGYPGDPAYRDFYRDIGFELDLSYIGPFVHETGHRLPTGIKYFAITDKNSDEKQPYCYQTAQQRVFEHALHFIKSREEQTKVIGQYMYRAPILVCPYDAELFGHWWYEGPEFIYQVIKLSSKSSIIDLVSPSDYLKIFPHNQSAVPSMSSWGEKGYNEVWLDQSNNWIYPHLHKAAERMIEVASNFEDPVGLLRRALNQLARELLLLQSSDWAFIMKSKTTVEYAVKRTKDHIFRFNKLYNDIMRGTINEKWLREVELRDNIFPDIDYRIYKNDLSNTLLKNQKTMK